MSSVVQANVTIQGSITALGTLGQTTYAPVDLGVNSLSLATGNLTSLITTSSSAPSGFAAAGEGSLVFPGTANAYISFGTTGQPFSNSNIYAFGDFVVEAWVNPSSLASQQFVVYQGDTIGNSHWLLYYNINGTVAWYSFINSVLSYALTTTSISTGTWTHLAVIHQSSTKRLQIYFNGQPQTLIAGTSGGFTMSGTIASYTTGIIPTTIFQTTIGGALPMTSSLTNLRVTTGSGAAQIYNNNAFTPSTSPLFPASNVTGGSLTTRLLVRVPLSPNKMVVPKLGGANCNTVLAFPPAPMTGYATNMTGLSYYGQGTYVASASSELGSQNSWKSFDKSTSTYWQTSAGTYTLDTQYTGTVFTVDANGTAYAGQWLQIQIPVSIVPSSYSLASDGANAPSKWFVLGSRDGTIWSLVDQQTGASSWTVGTYKTYSVNSSQSFTYYRIVIGIATGSIGTAPTIYELVLNGTIESVNVTADGRVGLGVVNPTRALEVAGDIVCSGTVSGGNPLMFRNRIINGNFDIWQRGTSFSLSAVPTYTSDRWRVNYDGTGATRTLSRQTFTLGQTAVPGNPKYYLRWAQTVAGSDGTFNQLEQLIESVLTFAGQTVTVSFWAQAVSGTPTITMYTGQQFGTGGSPSTAVYPANSPTYTLSTSWQYFTWTTFLPSITGKTLGTNGDDNVSFAFRAPSNATGTWNIASVQVEAGSIATPFEVRPYATELALCMRYFQKSYDITVAPGTITSVGTVGVMGQATIGALVPIVFPVPMKPGTVTTTIYNPTTGATGTARDNGDTASIAANAQRSSPAIATVSVGAGVTGTFYWFHYTASSEL